VKANPNVTVQDGDKVFEMTAREVHGTERDGWWQTAIDAYPTYTELQKRTEREIPIFVLE
jgi:deazaflavin-dependent oxidoreductase (nitroreductase family)